MLYIITEIFKTYNLTFCFKMKSTSLNYIQISLRKIKPVNTEKKQQYYCFMVREKSCFACNIESETQTISMLLRSKPLLSVFKLKSLPLQTLLAEFCIL